MQLLTVNNAKTIKGESLGYLTGILYMNPLDFDICPKATAGCRASCLFSAGRGVMRPVIEARTKRTQFYFNDRSGFIAQLREEIAFLERKAKRKGQKLAIRLNGTSDLPWWHTAAELMRAFPQVQFYDYTKVFKYWEKSQTIPNYHVTFSHSEENAFESQLVLNAGGQVAIVSSLERWQTPYAVYDGDEHDLTFLRGGGWLQLKPKGKAKKDNSGFNVRDTAGLISVVQIPVVAA